MNLLKTEPWNDGEPRYVGMISLGEMGFMEPIYRNPKDLFDNIRKDARGSEQIVVTSRPIPKEITDRCAWYRGRNPLDSEELESIVAQQREGGYDVSIKK